LQVGNGGASGYLGTGSVIDNTSLVFNVSGVASCDSVISGPGRLIKDGSGELILSGSNSYSGGTYVDAGTFYLSGSNVPAGSSLTVGAGAASIFNASAAVSPATSSFAVLPVPEPSTLALLSVAVCGAAVYQGVRSRRKKQERPTSRRKNQ
jgi:autotransporter-associated beta strand protein